VFQRWRWTVAALALFLAARLPFLLDDPAAGLVSYYQDAAFSVFDEGWWTANARELHLSGHLLGTGFDLFWVSPLFTIAVSAGFAVGGVGFVPARLVSIVAGMLAVGLLARVDRRRGGRSGEGPTPGEWAALLCAGSFAVAQLGRLATPEQVGLLCGVAGARALLRKDAPGAAGGGACAALAALAKPHFAFLVPALIAGAVLLARRDGRALLRPSLAAAGGAAVPLAIWAGIVLAHASDSLQLMTFYRHDRWFAGAPAGAGGLLALAKPAARTLLSGIIYRHPLFAYLPGVVLFAAAALPSVTGALLRPRRASPVSDAALVFGLWALAGALAISSVPFQPLRYFVPLIPALAYLAGCSLAAAGPSADESRVAAVTRWLTAALVAVQVAFAALSASLLPALAARSAGDRVRLLDPEPFHITTFLLEAAKRRSLSGLDALPRETTVITATVMTSVAALAVGLLVAALAGRRLARPWRVLERRRARTVAVLAIVLLEAFLWIRWLPERSRTLPEMSRDLAARVGPDALISPAGTYSLGNELRYDSGSVREYRMFDADGPATHFLVLEDHPRIGRLPDGEIERRHAGSRRIRAYELTGGYVYGLYARAAPEP
jgi:4-amino-4-deoxy-L-arabinose transferase-like glycosyltransferase